MGDMGDDFRAMSELRKKRHQEWHTDNRRILDNSAFKYTDKGETLLFRERGKPKVDFYPSTGRWRDVGKQSPTRGGGATRFLLWYEKQII